MYYLTAILFPFVPLFYMKKPVSGYISFIIQVLALISVPLYPYVYFAFIVWFLLILWTFFEISDYNNKQQLRGLIKKMVKQRFDKLGMSGKSSEYERDEQDEDEILRQHATDYSVYENREDRDYDDDYNYQESPRSRGRDIEEAPVRRRYRSTEGARDYAPYEPSRSNASRYLPGGNSGNSFEGGNTGNNFGNKFGPNKFSPSQPTMKSVGLLPNVTLAGKAPARSSEMLSNVQDVAQSSPQPNIKRKPLFFQGNKLKPAANEREISTPSPRAGRPSALSGRPGSASPQSRASSNNSARGGMLSSRNSGRSTPSRGQSVGGRSSTRTQGNSSRRATSRGRR